MGLVLELVFLARPSFFAHQKKVEKKIANLGLFGIKQIFIIKDVHNGTTSYSSSDMHILPLCQAGATANNPRPS